MTACRYVAADQPRIVVGRHAEDCDGGDHDSCLPCSEPHCSCCSVAHADGACPTCLAAIRDDLTAIANLHTDLRRQATHGGNNGRLDAARPIPGGEAMVMLGPAANPRAWQHRALSALVQRYVPGLHLPTCVAYGTYREGQTPDCTGCVPVPMADAAYLDDNTDELAPLWVLSTWEQDWRDFRNQPTDLRVTVARAAAYLDQHLTWAGTNHPAIDEFATDLRGCRRRLEDILTDGERDERSRVPCIDCGRRLIRAYADHAADDAWVCPRCRRRYSHGEYVRAKAAHLASEGADRYVQLRDGIAAIPRPERQVRGWLDNCQVRSYCDLATHAVYVWWPDLRRLHLATLADHARRRRGAA